MVTTPILQRRRVRTLSLLAVLTLLLSLSGGMVRASQDPSADLAGTSAENNFVTCSVVSVTLINCNLKDIANQATLDLMTDILPVAQQVNSAVTADTVMWMQAWGGDGHHGEDDIWNGGSGGSGGFAQMITTINEFQTTFGTTTIWYYIGMQGIYDGWGGSSTIVASLTPPNVLDGIALLAGGGGGGAAAESTEDGPPGGHGGSAIATTGQAVYGAGQDAKSQGGSGTFPGGSSQGAAEGGCTTQQTDPEVCGFDGYGGQGSGPTYWSNGNPNLGTAGAGGGDSGIGGGGGGGGYGGGSGGFSSTGSLQSPSLAGGAGGGSYVVWSTRYDQLAPQTFQVGSSAISIVFSLDPIDFAFDAPVAYPFGLTNPGNITDAAPAFADLRNTGVPDAVVGDASGTLWYYPSSAGPSYGAPQQNFSGLAPADDALLTVPIFVDIDDDGVIDAFVGDGQARIWYYHNTGTASAPSFAAPVLNPFGIFVTDFHFEGRELAADDAQPTFVDLDGDGDQDLLVGVNSPGTGAYQLYLENTGTASAPAFATPVVNPFGINSTEAYVFVSPTFADMDGDGDYDLFFGDGHGDLYYQNNGGTSSNPSFAAPSINSAGLQQAASGNARPFAIDISGDGEVDLFVGSASGNLWYYENAGPITEASALESGATPDPQLPYDAVPELALSLAGASGDQLTVTVHGSETFDASQVNRDIISLEDWFGNQLGRVTQSFWSSAVGDVNDDGYLDRTLTFVLDDPAALAANVVNQFCLSGVTYDGVTFRSCKYLE